MTLWMLFLTVYLSAFSLHGQIANYINNGGFEFVQTNTSTPLFYSAKYWGGTDSSKFYGELLSKNTVPIKVPLSGYTYQWPRHGNNHLGIAVFCSTCSFNIRGYPRNRLKQVLRSNTSYCFSMYINLTNQSSYGIDAIGAYFSDNSIDTISQCNYPITYLTPQVQNPTNNIITDTLNWVLIRGQFTSNGTEKYVMIGNFRTDPNTNKILVNSTNLPTIFCNYLIDDVSLIESNLPAYAGRDTSVAPGSTVFIGRQPDVGIDEACVWYKLPSAVPINTVAGFSVNPTTTSTYVVVQTICGLIKSDTVVIHMNLVGLEKLKLLNNELRIYPSPAKDAVYLQVANEALVIDFTKVCVLNNLGQLVREEELRFVEGNAQLLVADLAAGYYSICIKNSEGESITKKLLIAR